MDGRPAAADGSIYDAHSGGDGYAGADENNHDHPRDTADDAHRARAAFQVGGCNGLEMAQLAA